MRTINFSINHALIKEIFKYLDWSSGQLKRVLLYFCKHLNQQRGTPVFVTANKS